jgi:ribosomal protein S18 acetylase RimI-like enzyme
LAEYGVRSGDVSDEFTVAGGASVSLNPPTAAINCVDTLAPYRRRGIASLAIRACVEFAQARDCSLIFIVGPTEGAARLYRRLGFVDLDRIVTYTKGSENKAEESELAHVMAQSVFTHR